MKYILLLACLWCSTAMAQTPAVKTDSAAIIQKAQAEAIEAMSRENPVYFLCGGKNGAMFYIKGWQKGAVNLDSRKQVIPAWVIVFAVMPRKEDEKK